MVHLNLEKRPEYYELQQPEFQLKYAGCKCGHSDFSHCDEEGMGQCRECSCTYLIPVLLLTALAYLNE